MNAILTLAAKDLRLLVRDRKGLFWVIAFPLLMALFFGSMFGGAGGDDGPRKIRIQLVDEDASDASRDVVERLRSTAALDVETTTREAAWKAVQEGRAAAFVALPKGFGDAVGQFGESAPKVEIGADPSRRAERGMLQGIVAQAVVRRVFGSPGGAAADDAWSPLRVDVSDVTGPSLFEPGRKPRSGYEISFPSAVLWGLLGCAATFAISLVLERTGGTYLRLIVAPIGRSHVLLGKGLACFVSCLAVTTTLLAVGAFAFSVRVQNAPGLVAAVFACGVCFSGLMMFLATLGRTERAVAGAGWGVVTIFAMLGGGMMPLAFMPKWMQTASDASPVKWGILALEGAIWRGFDMAQMATPCAVLVGIGVAGFLLGARILGRTEG